MKKVLWWSLILAVGAGFLLLVAGLIFFVWGPGASIVEMMRHQNPGPFDRQKMEAVVEKVRLMHLAPGEQKALQMGTVSDPGSSVPHDSLFGCVTAWVSKSGKLTVLIVTNDMNHAGTYGFVYSEEPVALGLSEFDGWNAEGQIDDHWWKAGNHLN